MHTKSNIIWSSLLVFLLVSASSLQAQTVWENPKNPVHDFLARQAQKGNIEITDFILPLSRREISSFLTTLRDSTQNLTTIERKEIDFYLKEYSEFDVSESDTTTFLKQDQRDRWRLFSVTADDFKLRSDPLINLETFQGAGKSIARVSNGFQFWGHINRNLTFQASFVDITEFGTGIDTVKQFTNEPGIIRTANARADRRVLNYSNWRGNFTYSWKNGTVSIGKDNLLFGYGENGKVILSDKAPSYPMIRFDYQPLKWLKFNYAHSWLHSALIDSVRTYSKGNSIYGTDREIYIPKFMATHSLSFFPVRGLSLSIGESMVYSDNLDAGYLIPIMFFKAYDQYASRYRINSGSNGQFFFQASSRNHLRNTHFYGSFFIDEIRASEAFNKQKSRNHIGFNIGGSITDLGVKYLTLGAEYTRLNPYTYQNLVPAQTYTSQTYNLGDWIGENADRSTVWIKYNPAPRLTTSVQFNYIRKGNDGNLEDQYYAEPQPKFLDGGVTDQKQMLVSVRYEFLNSLRVLGSYQRQAGIIRPTLQPTTVPDEFRLGISYGF